MRYYFNKDESSPVYAIAIPEGSGCLADLLIRVIFRDSDSVPSNEFLYFKHKEIDDHQRAHYLPMKADKYLFGIQQVTIELLEAGLINQEFRYEVFTAEENLYHENKKIDRNRREYIAPLDETIIQAFLVQLDGQRFRAFIRYNEGALYQMQELGEKVGISFETFGSYFEDYAVVYSRHSKIELPIPTAINKLHAAGIISEKFKEALLKQEMKISNIPRKCKPESYEYLFNQFLKEVSFHARPLNRPSLFSLPRPYQEIHRILDSIESKQTSMKDGFIEITRIASRLGNQHPVLDAANKYLGILRELSKEESNSFAPT